MSAQEKHALAPGLQAPETLRVAPADLRWCCDEAWLPFASTDEVDPLTGVVGQDDALEALRFGLEMPGPGQHVFVRGLAGTGRLALVRQLLDDIRPTCPLVDDRCYVHNFAQPDRPRLLTLPRGHGTTLRRRIDELIAFIQQDLGPRLASDALRAQQDALNDRLQDEIRRVGEPLEEDLRAHHLALVPVQAGATMQPAILPVIDGTPVSPERFRALRAQGTIDDAEATRLYTQIASFGKRMAALGEHIAALQNAHHTDVQRLYEQEARRILQSQVQRIIEEFPQPAIESFLADIIEDIATRRLHTLEEDTAFTRLYRINVILPHAPDEACPMVAEVGQVNGPAVSHAGPLMYGFPIRITATIGPGTAGAINIEREADLSGASTRKAFTFWAACCAFSSARPTRWLSRPPLRSSKATGASMGTPPPAPRCVACSVPSRTSRCARIWP